MADLYKPNSPPANRYLKTSPTCKEGGKYTMGKVGEKPVCSFHGSMP